MDTPTKALIGAADDEKRLFALLFYPFGLGFLKYGVRGLAVAARLGHGALGTGELGGGDDFHGFGDLFDVPNGFETAFDLAEGGVGGGIGSEGAIQLRFSVLFDRRYRGIAWCCVDLQLGIDVPY